MTATPTVSHDQLLEFYRQMWRMRLTEERATQLFREEKTVGRIYTGRGQEAISVATASALAPQDVVAPLYRDMGALLVRGVTLREIFCQYLGRSNSSNRGKDSGLHISAPERGVGVNMISTLTASLPVAVGIALSFKIRHQPRVAMTYLGDGATSTGSAHEGLNFAAARKLPIVFVCENNQWALSTPNSKQFAVSSLIERAAGYGIAAARVDGNDAAKVFEAARSAVDHARGGRGPFFIEATTLRMDGHSATDPAAYVPREMRREWRQRDPIKLLEDHLRQIRLLDDERCRKLRRQIAEEVEDAVGFAEASPIPAAEEALTDVFAREVPNG